MPFDQLTIIGVGLIGGSVGLAAKARGLCRRVVGVGRDERTLARAQADGAIDSFSTNISEGVQAADLVVVCTPVDRVATDVVMATHKAPPRCVVTDVGSTKGNIVRDLVGKLPPAGAMFVGSHPLAGSEKRGSANAVADLFVNRVVVVTPTADTDLEAVVVVVDRSGIPLSVATDAASVPDTFATSVAVANAPARCGGGGGEGCRWWPTEGTTRTPCGRTSPARGHAYRPSPAEPQTPADKRRPAAAAV